MKRESTSGELYRFPHWLLGKTSAMLKGNEDVIGFSYSSWSTFFCSKSKFISMNGNGKAAVSRRCASNDP